MFTLQKLSLLLVGTTIVFMGVKPANAITLSTGGVNHNDGQGLVSGISGTTTINFNNGQTSTPDGFAQFSSNGSAPTIVQGSIAGQYAEPAGDTSPFLAISPEINTLSSTPIFGEVTINFAQALDYFGFYWGSVDTFNTVLLFNGDQLVGDFSGSNVPGTTATGNQTSPQDNTFVNFSANNNGEDFNTVVLLSTGNAFETDNFAYRKVPEPSAMFGLLAFGAVGAISALKRKQKQIS